MEIKPDPFAPQVQTSGFVNTGLQAQQNIVDTAQSPGFTGLTYTPPPPHLQAPCPSCGYCPHCGRGGHNTSPYWHGQQPYITYTTPYYNGSTGDYTF